MLLNALMRRMNGGMDIASSRISSTYRRASPRLYKKFPMLSDVLLKLLGTNHNDPSSSIPIHKIFPALEIIERFGIPQSRHEQIFEALLIHRASPIWAIREKAAKAVAVVLAPRQALTQISSFLAKNWWSQNDLHGRLLSTKYLMGRISLTYEREGKRASEIHDMDIC